MKEKLYLNTKFPNPISLSWRQYHQIKNRIYMLTFYNTDNTIEFNYLGDIEKELDNDCIFNDGDRPNAIDKDYELNEGNDMGSLGIIILIPILCTIYYFLIK